MLLTLKDGSHQRPPIRDPTDVHQEPEKQDVAEPKAEKAHE